MDGGECSGAPTEIFDRMTEAWPNLAFEWIRRERSSNILREAPQTVCAASTLDDGILLDGLQVSLAYLMIFDYI